MTSKQMLKCCLVFLSAGRLHAMCPMENIPVSDKLCSGVTQSAVGRECDGSEPTVF